MQENSPKSFAHVWKEREKGCERELGEQRMAERRMKKSATKMKSKTSSQLLPRVNQ